MFRLIQILSADVIVHKELLFHSSVSVSRHYFKNQISDKSFRAFVRLDCIHWGGMF